VDSIVTPPPRPHHPTPVSFRHLLESISGTSRGASDAEVTGVSINAGQVFPGDVFVGLPGTTHHGASFAQDAVAAGASAVITDDDGAALLGDLSCPVGVVANPRALLGRLSGVVYGTPTPTQQVLAVTGTNGKTSVTFYLEDIMRRLGHTTALSNSALRQVAGEVFRTKLTTPEANELHAMLALGAERGVSVLCLEASAQAIERFRLEGLPIAVAGFTNLSHDHFEDYGDMDTYLATKATLFTPEHSSAAVVCVDTPWGVELASRSTVPTTTLAHKGGSAATWTYEVTGRGSDTTDFIVQGPEGDISTRIHAIGDHMVQNAALAVVMAITSGIAVETLRQSISPPTGEIGVVIPGRVEKVSGASAVSVYVDAGRSADAYEKTLTALRNVTLGSLIAVCGTSGNRDPSKRPIMGSVAATLADQVIITDDDPRFEDPVGIRQGLLSGARSVSGGAVVTEIPDPSEAIRSAINLAHPGDTIVWSGPGSQLYREVKGERIPFSARDLVRRFLRERGLLDSQGEGD